MNIEDFIKKLLGKRGGIIVDDTRQRGRYTYYTRVRDIVNDIYMSYIITQADIYGASNIDSKGLAEEAMLLILDIVENNKRLSDMEIAEIATIESNINRKWQDR